MHLLSSPDESTENNDEPTDAAAPACPLCESSLGGLTEQESSVHVNACLDGNPIPLPTSIKEERSGTPAPVITARSFKRPARPPKEAQANPFQFGVKK